MKPERVREHSQFSILIFGKDEDVRMRARLTVWTLVLYACWLGMVAFMNHRGLLVENSVYLIFALDLSFPPCFYLLIRSGFSRRFHDPALVVAQMVYASFAVSVSYVACPTLRASLMQCLCMVQIFGLFSLRPNEALRVGLLSAAMLLSTLLVVPALGISGFELDRESLRLATCSFIVVLLATSSRHHAMLRQRVRSERHALTAAVAQVNELVTHDALTGLFNRQYMQELLDREHARCERDGVPYCVALIDLDHFKQINDQHGHQVGDEVLTHFAKVAQQVLRNTDTMARWGGEEFLVLMPETAPDSQGLIGIARLHEQLAARQGQPWPGDLRVTFSAGVAACVGRESLEQLLERADRALYMAKGQGRDRSVIADELLAPSRASETSQRLNESHAAC